MRAFACSMLTTVVLAVCLTARVQAGNHDIENGRHNINMGSVTYPRDMQIIFDIQTVPSKPLRVQSHDVCYPSEYSNPIIITAFNVTDFMPNGKGGYAFVDSGGVGSGSLCLHLKTQPGEGYKFFIKVFGYFPG